MHTTDIPFYELSPAEAFGLLLMLALTTYLGLRLLFTTKP